MSIRVCFCGGSGHSGSVVAALPKLPEVELRGFCRTYPEEAMKAISPLGLKEYSTLEEMLDAEKPDILVSDGMFSRHGADALTALRRGIAVFCEKPAVLTTDQYQELYDAATRPGAPLFWTMQTSRYMDCFYTAKLLADAGAIGQIRMMNSQKSYKLGKRPAFFSTRETYGGTIPWVSIHAIDWMLWICGKPCLSAAGFQSRLDNHNNGTMEMTAVSVLELADNVIADVHTDYYRPENAPTHGDDRLRIVGSAGVLEVRDSMVYLINDTHDGCQPMPLSHAPRLLFEDFVRTMQGESGGLITTKDCLYSTYVALKAQEAADQHRILSL